MRNNRAVQRGFTLLEIMVVVFHPGRSGNDCRAQLDECAGACAGTHMLGEPAPDSSGEGDVCLGEPVAKRCPVQMSDLVPQYLQAEPFCPAGGGAAYTVNPVGTDPTCPTGLPNHTVHWGGGP
jgi:hypothetical protein